MLNIKKIFKSINIYIRAIIGTILGSLTLWVLKQFNFLNINKVIGFLSRPANLFFMIIIIIIWLFFLTKSIKYEPEIYKSKELLKELSSNEEALIILFNLANKSDRELSYSSLMHIHQSKFKDRNIAHFNILISKLENAELINRISTIYHGDIYLITSKGLLFLDKSIRRKKCFDIAK